MKEDKPFIELFVSMVHGDYRFPILEIFAFLFALGTFAFGLGNVTLAQDEPYLFMLIGNLMNIPLLIFFILILKNIAYGLGSDLQRGKIQTFFSYPVKRRNILIAKLLSAIGITLLLFFGVQLFALSIIAPAMILPNLGIVLLTYFANFGYVLLLTAIILLVTLLLKRGIVNLVVGVFVYLAIGISVQFVSSFALATNTTSLFQIMTLLNPSTALLAHYGLASANISWAPTLLEATYYVIAHYAIIAFLFLLAYYYFSRRLRT